MFRHSLSQTLEKVLTLLKGLDPLQLKLAVKTSLAVVITFAVCLVFGWIPSTAAISTFVLAGFYLGASIQKTVLRLSATLIACAAGVILMAFFPQDRLLLTLAVTMWTAFNLYFLQKSSFAYFWLFMTLMPMIICYFTIGYPQFTFSFAVAFCSAVLVGATSLLTLDVLVWPNSSGKYFEKKLQDYFLNCQKLLALLRENVGDFKSHEKELAGIKKSLIMGMPKLQSTLETAIFDFGRYREFKYNYKDMLNQLSKVLNSLISFSEMLRDYPSSRVQNVLSTSGDLKNTLLHLEKNFQNLILNLKNKTEDSLAANPTDFNSFTNEEDLALKPMDKAFLAGLRFKIQALTSNLENLQKAILSLEKPQTAKELPHSAPPKFTINKLFLHKAVFGALVQMFAVGMWITLNWKGSNYLMLMVTLGVIFYTMAPLLPFKLLFYPFFIASGLGAVVYFLVMPQLSSFYALGSVLLSIFLILGYFQVRSNPGPSALIVALTGVMFCILIGVDHPQSYSFSTFIDAFIGLGGGILLFSLPYYLFRPQIPEKELRQHTQSFFGIGKQIFSDWEKGISLTPQTLVSRTKALSQHLKLYGLWSMFVDYKFYRDNNSKKVQALATAMKTLFFRLQALEEGLGKYADEFNHKNLKETFGKLNHRYKESFSHLEEMLANGNHPVNISPLSIEELESIWEKQTLDESQERTAGGAMVLAGFYRALGDSLVDCQNQVNALNWQVWKYPHF